MICCSKSHDFFNQSERYAALKFLDDIGSKLFSIKSCRFVDRSLPSIYKTSLTLMKVVFKAVPKLALLFRHPVFVNCFLC